MPATNHEHYTPSADPETALLQHELSEAHKTIRALTRQLAKEQQRLLETSRAHKKTVVNLAEAGREQVSLAQDRDTWKARAERSGLPFTIGGLTLELTPEEAQAIHKALARLYQADADGNAERLRAWDAALEPLEQ
ncbi:MAG: hypothetical protein U0Z44_20680 [Kouleothrix sp.]|jgi:23S rRNA pseudoU1915 N3-methylase RlmH|nr:hypothetical protein [Kouleothrix sp.]